MAGAAAAWEFCKRYLSAYCGSWVTEPGAMLVKHTCFLSAIYVVVGIYSDPNRAYMFSEYSAKFVPFLRDAPVSGWFDTWAMGDPRPRIVNVVGTVINLRVREFYSHLFVLPPALGISWLIYPVTLTVLYRALRKARLSTLVSLSAVLLWALSPSALDSLVICYVPAKSLMPLAFALLFCYLVELTTRAESGKIAVVGGLRLSAAIGIVIFLALLTDESSAIAVAVLAIVFLPTFLSKAGGFQAGYVALTALACALAGFLMVAELGYPFLNRHFGQVPLAFFRTSIFGPTAQYQSTTAASVVSSHFSGFGKNFSPLGMAFTMLSAHLLPWRYVPGFWTWSSVRSFGVWPPAEAAFVFSFSGILVILALTLESKWLGFALRLLLSIAVLTVLYAALLLPIAPSILEINYYGGLFSLPFALAVAVIVCGPRKSSGRQFLPALLICVLACAEILSYEQTSLRNRRQYSNFEYFWNQQKEKPWKFADLEHLSDQVTQGHFGSEIKEHPYPSRAFAYLFELEANREHHLGQQVDFSPSAPNGSLYSVVLQEHNEWYERNGVELRKPPLPSKQELLKEGAIPMGASRAKSLTQNTTWKGYGRDWGFEQSFDKSGGYTNKYWLLSLMRLWQVSGSVGLSNLGVIQFSGADGQKTESFSLMEYNNTYYAMGADNVCLFQFTSIPNTLPAAERKPQEQLALSLPGFSAPTNG